jgi:hypothetical protein
MGAPGTFAGRRADRLDNGAGLQAREAMARGESATRGRTAERMETFLGVAGVVLTTPTIVFAAAKPSQTARFFVAAPSCTTVYCGSIEVHNYLSLDALEKWSACM